MRKAGKMKPDFKIKERYTKKKGIAYDLYFRWKGQRYEPNLGHNLKPHEALIKARQMVDWIVRGEMKVYAGTGRGISFKQAVDLYWQMFRLQERVDSDRATNIIDNHLMPFFEHDELSDMTVERGLTYIEQRKEQGRAMGTIRRECQVLNRILNICVDLEKLDRNRFKRIFQFLPAFKKRERICTRDELLTIQSSASPHLWRFVTVALHTGLRESLILAIEPQWISPKDDGWWLLLPPPRSKIKNNPRMIPLNDIAVWALTSDQGNRKRIFGQWNTRHTLRSAWVHLMTRTGIDDLTMHDFRHSFATALQNLGVDLEVRQALLGHKVQSQTMAYSHGGPGWEKRLRRGVTKLTHYYKIPFAVTNKLTDKLNVPDGRGVK